MTHPHQDALRQLEMARFTRRYPAVLDTLLKQMLGMVAVSGGGGGGRGTWVLTVHSAWLRSTLLLPILTRPIFSALSPTPTRTRHAAHPPVLSNPLRCAAPLPPGV
jgi:hypothetical protein